MNGKTSLQGSELYENCHHTAERRSNTRFFFGLLIALWTILFAVNCWHSAFGGVQVDGGSMLNTLKSGEYLLVRYFDEGDELPYGSVIVVDIGHYPEVQEYNRQQREKNPKWVDTRYLIKRLIAKEGDKVRCKDGVLEVWYAGTDGYQVLNEPYAYYGGRPEKYDFAEYDVGEGEIFFLGDNRNISLDSRYKEGWSHIEGLYKESDIHGIVPTWAIENQNTIEKIFFWRELLEEKLKNNKR